MYTENSAPFRMRFALHVWCLITPPPRITLRPVRQNQLVRKQKDKNKHKCTHNTRIIS